MAEYNPDEFFHHKQTNADRIRQMSDEELASLIAEIALEAIYAFGNYANRILDLKYWKQVEREDKNTQIQISDWLKQEVDDAT